MSTPSTPGARPRELERSTWPRVARLLAVCAVPGLACFVAARSYLRETRELFPSRRPVAATLASSGLPGVELVSFRDSEGARLRGWYAPSQNHAGLVLLHGAGGDRSSLLPEARFLSARGFGVLLFDLPGHGESEGDIHWGEGERRALVAAVDFLSARPDVDPSRLGAFAFSMGGAVLARAAGSEPRLRAVVLAGTPSDQSKQVRWENRRYGPLSQLPALWAVRRHAPSLFDDLPVDRVGSITPRPVLVVTGTEDTVVPAYLAEELFAAVREPKEFLRIPGAGHGGFDEKAPVVYPERISQFFGRALLGDRPLH